MKSITDLSRMLAWLIVGFALYSLSYIIGTDHPTAQVIAQKLGNVTTFAWIGYWIARAALGRVKRGTVAFDRSPPLELVARAIIILAAILGGALGL